MKVSTIVTIVKQVNQIDFNLIETSNSFYYKYKEFSQTSIIFNKFFLILIKIKSWLKIISDNNFMSMCDYNSLNNFLDVNNQSDTITTIVTNNSLVVLLEELGKEKAIESLKPNFVDIKNGNTNNQFSSDFSTPVRVAEPFISPGTKISLTSSQNSSRIDNSPKDSLNSGPIVIDPENSKPTVSSNLFTMSVNNGKTSDLNKNDALNYEPQIPGAATKSLFDKQLTGQPTQSEEHRGFIGEAASATVIQNNPAGPSFGSFQRRNTIENFDNMLKDIFMENQMDDLFNVTLPNVDFDDRYFQQLMNDGGNTDGFNRDALSPSSLSGLFHNDNEPNNPFAEQPIYKQVQSHWQEVFDFSPVLMKTNSSGGTPINNDEQDSGNFGCNSEFKAREMNLTRALSFNNNMNNNMNNINNNMGNNMGNNINNNINNMDNSINNINNDNYFREFILSRKQVIVFFPYAC